MRCLRHGRAVGGVVDVHEDIVAEGRIAQGRGARRNDQAMGVQVGRIAKQFGLAGLAHVFELGGVQQRQLVDQADLQRVAGLQREPHPP